VLTHSCNDLSLKTILALESSSKVTDTSMAITNNIRYFSDVIEHVSTCEEENHNQADSSPDVAVLDDWDKKWPGNGTKGYRAENGCSDGNDTSPVDWSLDGGMWFTWELACDP